MLNDGIYYLHQFPIEDDNGVLEKGTVLKPLRFFSGNSNLTEDDIDGMIEYITEVAKQIIEKEIV